MSGVKPKRFLLVTGYQHQGISGECFIAAIPTNFLFKRIIVFMKVIVVSKNSMNVIQYDNVTSITKNATTGIVTIAYGSTTAIVNPVT